MAQTLPREPQPGGPGAQSSLDRDGRLPTYLPWFPTLAESQGEQSREYQEHFSPKVMVTVSLLESGCLSPTSWLCDLEHLLYLSEHRVALRMKWDRSLSQGLTNRSLPGSVAPVEISTPLRSLSLAPSFSLWKERELCSPPSKFPQLWRARLRLQGGVQGR